MIKYKNLKLIRALFLVIGLIFPLGCLLGLITAKVAIPVMFICIGGYELFNGLTVNSKNKFAKILSISFGMLIIIFGIFIALTSYFK